MSLSAVLTALAEFVSDELVNSCERPSPRVLRYFGTGGLPQDCCTEDGVLSVSWSQGYVSKTFPSQSREAVCPGKPVYIFEIRYDVCWKAPEVDEHGVELLDDVWDADAAVLSDVADCIARRLIRLSCGKLDTEKARALLEALHCSDFLYRDVVPRVGGGCARITWTVFAGVRITSADS